MDIKNNNVSYENITSHFLLHYTSIPVSVQDLVPVSVQDLVPVHLSFLL